MYFSTAHTCLRTFAILSALVISAAANSLDLTVYRSGSDGFQQIKVTGDSTSSSLSNAIGGVYASGNGSVYYGSSTLHAYASSSFTAGGSFQTSSGWTDDYTIDGGSLNGTTGTATFSYRGGVVGNMRVENMGSSQSGARLSITVDGTSIAYELNNGSGFPQPISTFDVVKTFTFGSAFSMASQLGVAALPTGGNPAGIVDFSFKLSGAGISVKDATNASAAYTMTSHTGSAKGSTVVSGGSYSGFTLTNSTTGSLGTTLTLNGGNASASTQALNAAFAPAPLNSALASDVVNFSGTGIAKFVLKLSYDPALAVSLFGNELNAVLLWRNPATGLFENSVNGNSDGGATQQHYVGAYLDPEQYQLGNYGVDPVNHVVWAVIDHNSEFAVGTAVPEPATRALALASLGVIASARRIRRKLG